MQANVVLKELAIHLPDNILENQFFINHFQEQGKDIDRLLLALGREKRHVAEMDIETTLSMGIEASKRVLEKSGFTGRDMDMIVFVSGTPEYLWPPNSVAIHHALQGKEEAVVYDMNAACAGMVIAVEQISRNMSCNPQIQRALVIGAEQMHRFASKNDPVTYASFGDGAAAIILERNSNSESGFIDSAYSVKTESIEKIVLPACGVSKLYDTQTSAADKQIRWENVNNDNAFVSTIDLISKLLERNQLTVKDIKAFCFSQLSRKNILKIQEVFDTDLNKFPIVGTEYGYTGAASPFMAFERSIANGQVKRGDYVVFWSVGAGSTACATLYKY